MPTTRSATKQTRLEETSKNKISTEKVSNWESKNNHHEESTATRKRKAQQDGAFGKNAKKLQTHLASDGTKPIIINRAPVLQLWSASVAEFLNPDLPWDSCLSIGSAVSSLCAISKGRAIGVIDPKDSVEKPKKEKQGEEVAVMGFHLRMKDGSVLLGGKAKAANEEGLRKKFGEEGYQAAGDAFRDGLASWEGCEDELDGKAFHMYERFRPSVAGGQRGWGKKGELDLEEVRSVLRK
jgi:hypothetical protein